MQGSKNSFFIHSCYLYTAFPPIKGPKAALVVSRLAPFRAYTDIVISLRNYKMCTWSPNPTPQLGQIGNLTGIRKYSLNARFCEWDGGWVLSS